mgnify:FL=1
MLTKRFSENAYSKPKMFLKYDFLMLVLIILCDGFFHGFSWHDVSKVFLKKKTRETPFLV